MIDFDIWLAYVATVLLLMSTPGPSQLLVLANTVRYGFLQTLATIAGDLSANSIQMIIVALGLAVLLIKNPQILVIIQWLGVIYLCVLAAKSWWEKTNNNPQKVKVNQLYWQGFTNSALNPKAIVFFAALLPQFITSTQPLAGQFFILAFTYLVIDFCFLSCYGYFAHWIMRRFSHLITQRLQKISALLLLIAAFLLALKIIWPLF